MNITGIARENFEEAGLPLKNTIELYRFFRLDAWAGQAGKRAAPCKPGVQ